MCNRALDQSPLTPITLLTPSPLMADSAHECPGQNCNGGNSDFVSTRSNEVKTFIDVNMMSLRRLAIVIIGRQEWKKFC